MPCVRLQAQATPGALQARPPARPPAQQRPQPPALNARAPFHAAPARSQMEALVACFVELAALHFPQKPGGGGAPPDGWAFPASIKRRLQARGRAGAPRFAGPRAASGHGASGSEARAVPCMPRAGNARPPAPAPPSQGQGCAGGLDPRRRAASAPAPGPHAGARPDDAAAAGPIWRVRGCAHARGAGGAHRARRRHQRAQSAAGAPGAGGWAGRGRNARELARKGRLQSRAAITGCNHELQSRAAITDCNHGLQSRTEIGLDGLNLRQEPPSAAAASLWHHTPGGLACPSAPHEACPPPSPPSQATDSAGASHRMLVKSGNDDMRQVGCTAPGEAGAGSMAEAMHPRLS
jgi:hypothetical protein